MKKQIMFFGITAGIIFLLVFSANAQQYHGNRDNNRGGYSSNQYGRGDMNQDHHNYQQNNNDGRSCDDRGRVTVVYQNRFNSYARPNYCAPRQIVVVQNTCRPTYCQPRPRCGYR